MAFSQTGEAMRIITLILIVIVTAFGCNKGEVESLQKQLAEAKAENDKLSASLNAKDQAANDANKNHAELQLKLAAAREEVATLKLARAENAREKPAQKPDVEFTSSADFLDNTNKYVGKTVTLCLRPASRYPEDRTIGSFKIATLGVEFQLYDHKVEGTIWCDLGGVGSPPNIFMSEPMVVVFECKNGRFDNGNRVIEIKRYDRQKAEARGK
jgi:hypothetical protein